MFCTGISLSVYQKLGRELHLTNPVDKTNGLFMCFGRLIGAATGLEVARRGAHEWVEGQMDKQTDRRWQMR